MSFNPQNILIIDFGQIGDVILSLPALRAVREKFPQAKITVLVGKSSAGIIELADFVDEKIAVNRAELRRGNKLRAIGQIFKLVGEIRRRRFDFVIDLHSLYETNLLGFLAGAKHRLFASRANRSLDFLSNFEPKPPPIDRAKHLTDFYLAVLSPLGIENAKRFVKIHPKTRDLETINNLLHTKDVRQDKKLVGLFPGAGNASRRWKLENFAQLAKLLSENKNLQPVVFLGPEEKNLRGAVEETFPAATLIFDDLTLPQFAAALSRLEVLISNDTGAIHIGAIAGTSVVVVLDKRAPTTFMPLAENLRVVQTGTLDEIGVAEVFQAAQNFL